jgi:PD-(D/E)XK nuclease superfamily
MSFKKCRRKWDWYGRLEPMGMGVESAEGTYEEPEALWFGTGVHYALEDWCGYNKYGHPARAFRAYAEASLASGSMPVGRREYEEVIELSDAMMIYYANYWLKTLGRRLETLWIDGVPQQEVEFEVELPWNPQDWYPTSPYTRAVYQGRIDRVVVNEMEQLLLLDYKTAARYETTHLQNDAQVSAYLYASKSLYPWAVVSGMVYEQLKKAVPKPPKLLSSGKLSTSKTQNAHCPSLMYRQAICDTYGDLESAPIDVVLFLDTLMLEEQSTAEGSKDGSMGDQFVRRDIAYRNSSYIDSEESRIKAELIDILNPDLSIYPNPTRDCGYCQLLQACISKDDGSDYEHELNRLFPEREIRLAHRPSDSTPTTPTTPLTNSTAGTGESRISVPVRIIRKQTLWQQYLPQPDQLEARLPQELQSHRLLPIQQQGYHLSSQQLQPRSPV